MIDAGILLRSRSFYNSIEKSVTAPSTGPSGPKNFSSVVVPQGIVAKRLLPIILSWRNSPGKPPRQLINRASSLPHMLVETWVGMGVIKARNGEIQARVLDGKVLFGRYSFLSNRPRHTLISVSLPIQKLSSGNRCCKTH